MYRGEVILNEELALSLFEFSEKYLFEELRVSCEKYISRNLRWDNCFKIYEIACFYEADSLKKKALFFLEAHIGEITASKAFEDLPKSTYILLKRMQWNDKMIFDPSFAQLMNGYRQSGSESSGWRDFLK